MLSCNLGYTSDEHVDEVIMVFLSIFTPGKPPTIMFDYAQFIADKNAWTIHYTSHWKSFQIIFSVVSHVLVLPDR